MTIVTNLVVSSNSNVETTREEVTKLLPRYKLIRDVLNQDIASLGEEYLPDPSEKPFEERTQIEHLRYRNYCKRAVFVNYTQRTLSGFVGQIFSREPEVKVPASLDALVKDATGDGLSLEQLSKDAAAEVMSLGRYGLFTDYPSLTEPATEEQRISGEIRPTIIPYIAENIINWRTKRRLALQVLSLVVLREDYVKDDDGFDSTKEDQFRVLDLDPATDKYRVRVFRKDDGWGGRDAHPVVNGTQPNTIPFTFIGSINNDPIPDVPPMYDLAQMNIAHYRNSADYEESVFLCGQPTYVVSGITENWLKNVLGGIVRFGSRFGLPLAKDAKAEIIQAEPNQLVAQAMKDKELQMAAMGADFLKDQNVARTATEAAIDDSSRTSMISNASKNLSAGIKFALEWAALYQGESEESVEFKLNSEFDLTKLTSQDIDAVIKLEASDLLSWTEARSQLAKAGKTSLSDEEAKAEIEVKQAAALEKAAAEFDINNPVVDPNASAGNAR